MTAIENGRDMVALLSGDKGKDGVEFAVANVWNGDFIVITLVAIDGANCIDGSRADQIQKSFVVTLRREVIRAMSGEVDDDVVTRPDLVVGDDTEKDADDVVTGGIYCAARGRRLLGPKKELNMTLGNLEVIQQVLLHRLCVFYTTVQRIQFIIIDTNEYSPESRTIDTMRGLQRWFLISTDANR